MGEPRGRPRQRVTVSHGLQATIVNPLDAKIRRKPPVRTPNRAAILLRVIAAIFDGGRRETRFVTTLAVLLVLIRAAAFTLSERINFNSDQAIVGLMAKHLSEFRTFPFFYYGLNYLLAVQA